MKKNEEKINKIKSIISGCCSNVFTITSNDEDQTVEIIMKDVVGAKNNEARYIIPFKNLDVILNISRINYAFNEILRNYHVN